MYLMKSILAFVSPSVSHTWMCLSLRHVDSLCSLLWVLPWSWSQMCCLQWATLILFQRQVMKPNFASVRIINLTLRMCQMSVLSGMGNIMKPMEVPVRANQWSAAKHWNSKTLLTYETNSWSRQSSCCESQFCTPQIFLHSLGLCLPQHLSFFYPGNSGGVLIVTLSAFTNATAQNQQQILLPVVILVCAQHWWKQFVAWYLNRAYKVFLMFANAEQLHAQLNVWQSLVKVSCLIFKLLLENVPSKELATQRFLAKSQPSLGGH